MLVYTGVLIEVFKMKIKIISVLIIFIMVSSGLVVYGLMQNNTNNSVPVKYNSYTTTGSLPSFINQSYKISDIAIHNEEKGEPNNLKSME